MYCRIHLHIYCTSKLLLRIFPLFHNILPNTCMILNFQTMRFLYPILLLYFVIVKDKYYNGDDDNNRPNEGELMYSTKEKNKAIKQ